MKEELLNLVAIFSSGLTMFENNQYIPKIRDYFVEYILECKSDSSIDDVLKYEFTKKDLINSTIYYIQRNDNVRSKSAIDDYLIAVNRFFAETIFEKYPNQNLITIRPFTILCKDVEQGLLDQQIYLEDRQTSPAINEEQYNFILKHINEDNEASYKTKQIHIIIKLTLLYGLSPDRIINMKRNNYLHDERVLEIVYSANPYRSLKLDVPYKVHKLIEDFLKNTSSERLEHDNFFVNRNGKPIKHDFPTGYLKLLKERFFTLYPIEAEVRNPFTPTGLAKFAITRMILNGINPSVISDLTGYMGDIISDCQNKVNEMKELNRNRYINHMIRGIQTYEEI